MTLFDHEGQLLLSTAIPVAPKVKERPRATKTGGKIYTPATTREAEERLRNAFLETVGDFQPFDRPIDVRWEFTNDCYYLEVYGALDYENRKLRGDTDNYMKLASDALNGIAWVDDRLIIRTSGAKL